MNTKFTTRIYSAIKCDEFYRKFVGIVPLPKCLNRLFFFFFFVNEKKNGNALFMSATPHSDVIDLFCPRFRLAWQLIWIILFFISHRCWCRFAIWCSQVSWTKNNNKQQTVWLWYKRCTFRSCALHTYMIALLFFFWLSRQPKNEKQTAKILFVRWNCNLKLLPPCPVQQFKVFPSLHASFY